MTTGLGRRALQFSLEIKLEAPEYSSCASKCMDFGELWLSVPEANSSYRMVTPW